MAWVGMNDTSVKAQGQVLQAQSEAVGSLMGKIDQEIANLKSIWAGEDSVQFEKEWTGTHKGELQRIKDMLQAMSQKIDAEVKQQQDTSKAY